LPAKAGAVSLAFGLLAWTGFSFWPVLIFIVATSAVYFSESPERKALRSSFWLLAVFGLLGAAIPLGFSGAPFHGLISVFMMVVFGILAFGWLGLVSSSFNDRLLVHNLLNAALAAFFFVLAFYLTPSLESESAFALIAWFLAVFLGTLLLLTESLSFEVSLRGRGLKLTTWSFALILAEVSVLASFLPAGFLDAAAFLTLFYILGRDAILSHFRGFLSFSLIFTELTIFAVVLGLIFATVTWVLP
jgi:hypothetical protein